MVMNIARNAHLPLYVHFHGYDASRLLNDPNVVREYRRLFSLVNGIIAPSRYLADKLIKAGCAEERMHVIPCGVNADEFEPIRGRPNGQCLLAAGRFVPKKAPHHTINAFALVAGRFQDATLDMIGDGPLWTHASNWLRN
jgi:colanic acid/amylovoran biosynthesis glycosyltransferase